MSTSTVMMAIHQIFITPATNSSNIVPVPSMTSVAFEFKVNPDLNWINPATGPGETVPPSKIALTPMAPEPVQWAKVFGRH